MAAEISFADENAGLHLGINNGPLAAHYRRKTRSLMSFFDRQGFFEYLLRDRSKSGNSNANLEGSPEDDNQFKSMAGPGRRTCDDHVNDTFDIVTLRKKLIYLCQCGWNEL
ncbi:hypothetical protein ACJ73_01248 [Blastomyces percursus]|uniref:Uncharacterized protein n=1 Tax=Blastomyces percursus TaxID=1658174 RepID=A0A1J9RHA3_9EURO|nr:hypothetical protein ACJ73_01248 [Blastomyces percursus]